MLYAPHQSPSATASPQGEAFIFPYTTSNRCLYVPAVKHMQVACSGTHGSSPEKSCFFLERTTKSGSVTHGCVTVALHPDGAYATGCRQHTITVSPFLEELDFFAAIPGQATNMIHRFDNNSLHNIKQAQLVRFRQSLQKPEFLHLIHYFGRCLCPAS